jgi:hypothetical protein
MKKCPTCERTFEDSMRFCQSDGTPLVDVVEEAPVDPYKTIVSPAADDPFKTVVAAPADPPAPESSGDLLEMPEADPLRTMYVSEEDLRREMAAEEPAGAPVMDAPPEETPVPEPPRFEEPSLSPPSFGDMAPPPSPFASTGTPEPEPETYTAPDAASEDATLISPVAPIPSPFGEQAAEPETYTPPIPNYETPSEPQAAPQYAEPEPQVNPFDQPGGGFGRPEQQMEWAPPPAPDANWQNQPVGQNTPFQPPATSTGVNQTLPIVSLVFGIVSVCCYVSPVTGLVALITGFMGMKNANNDPSNYGGKGLAIAGMITGGIFFLIGILYWIYIIFIVGLAALGNLGR